MGLFVKIMIVDQTIPECQSFELRHFKWLVKTECKREREGEREILLTLT